MPPETTPQPEEDYPKLPPTLKVPIPILIVGKKVGTGTEGNVHKGEEQVQGPITVANPSGLEGRGESKAVKTRNLLGIILVIFKFRKDIWRRCKEAYEKEGLPHIDAELHEKAVIIDGKTGRRRVRNKVQVSPYIKDVGDNTVDYAMLTDPEIGQKVMIEVTNILVQAHSMAKNRGVGLDPFGMEAMMKIISSVPPAILLHMIDLLPEELRNLARELITTKPVRINNLVRFKKEGEEEPVVRLIDIGGLVLDEPVYGPILELLYELGMAGLTETVLLANRDLAEREGRAPNREVLTKLATMKEEKRDARAYQIIAETMLKILAPYLRKSVEDRKKKSAKETFDDAWGKFKTQVKGAMPTLS